MLTCGVFEEVCIGPTEQMFIAGAADITAADSQPLDDVRTMFSSVRRGKSSGFTP